MNTCSDYGYEILKLPKVKCSGDFDIEADERCCIYVSSIERKIRNTKSMVIVKYENDDDLITNFFLDTLLCEVRRDIKKAVHV